MRRNFTQDTIEKARAYPRRPALRSEDFELGFGQLAALAISYALHFRSHGVSRGSTISVRDSDPAVILASAMAAALLGCGWVFGGRALARAGAVDVTHRFCGAGQQEMAEEGAILIDASWSRRPEDHDPSNRLMFPGFASDDDTWLIFPSSGTTGTPKYMAFSHRIMLDRFVANAVEFPCGEEVCVFLFAVHSPPTLMRALCALNCGAGLVFSTDTEFWTRCGVTHVFGSPSQIGHVLGDAAVPGKFGKALIGGDRLPDELVRKLLGSFDTVVNTYGSTETNLVVENAKTPGADGAIETRTVWHDSEIQIVDDDDRPLAAGTEGIVRLRNGYLVTGYLNSPTAEASAFRDGWFYPGDRGVLSPERNFTVTGRTNELFNLGGVKVNAALLDYMLQTLPGVEDATSFLMPARDGLKELVALVKAGPDGVKPDIRSEARIRIAASISAEAVPKKIVFSDVIPRTENGKPDREACVAMAKTKRLS